jgi:GTP-binding protein
MTVINSAEFLKSSTSFEQCPTENLPEYAFIGRSNVGKSSLINKLCSQPKLAKTSSTPGKTQLINHFLINQQWFLVDLPGYGFAKMPVKLKKKMEIMINEYLVNRPNLLNIYVLVDSRHEPLEIDLDFMARLALNQLPFSIVFTKADKNKKTRTMENIDKYKEVLLQSWEELPPIFLTSSETGLGTSDILEDIARINLLY